MYLTRNIDEKFAMWAKEPERCPLILRGARQVGKSASVQAFGRQFRNMATVDFEADPRLAEVFAGKLDPQALVADLESLLGVRIKAGETLLFLDEIQECPRALMALRYFKEKLPELHVIAAGSLLEFALGDVSFPVGRVAYQYVYPLNFNEFLQATGRSLLAERRPRGVIANPSWALTKSTGDALKEALREYLVVGGMPAAVVAYQKTRSFLEVQEVQTRLIQGFRDDVPKYAQGDLQKRNVALVFGRLAAQVGEQVTYTKLLDDDSKRNKASVFLLEKAMLVHLVHATSPAGLPLAANAADAVFKPIFIDIGLMQKLCGRSAIDLKEAKDLVASFQGQVAEQFVGQELLALPGGSEDGRLFYWRRAEKSSSAEVDYLLARHAQVIPVEVKSGAGGRLRSLHLLLETFPQLQTAICLQDTGKSSKQGKVDFLPLFTQLI